MSKITLKDLRYKLNEDDIINILKKYGVEPVYNTPTAIIYPTVCHNLSGGSPKLYYYKNDHIFKCYTHCNDMFDIFTLLIKMHDLRNNPISIPQAITICGLSLDDFTNDDASSSAKEDIDYLYNVLHSTNQIVNLPHINEKILQRFVFDKKVLKLWVDEGISYDTMRKYGIAYDPIDNCIIIPNYDIAGKLISVRGRYLDEEALAKYKPINWGQKVLSHPSALNLFGLNINKDAIRRQKRAIIFESEKSVMMMDTIYGDKNCSVATLGQNISRQQIQLLLGLGVDEVILAYDADYTNYAQTVEKRKKYIRIANSLKPYFNVAVLMDLNHILKYKDSPIDCGKEKFEQILKDRIYI